jgi:hypothetical protein
MRRGGAAARAVTVSPASGTGHEVPGIEHNQALTSG